MTDDQGYEPALEFDCIECGRHIIAFGHPPDWPLICGACMYLPGWYTDPDLKGRIDPDDEAVK